MKETTNLVYIFIFAGIGFYIGINCKKWVYRFRRRRLKKKMGICDSFKGKGYRETIDGTNSEFCMNCGHPCGYHY